MSRTRVPVQPEIAPAESTGVCVTTPSITPRARWMSSRPTTAAHRRAWRARLAAAAQDAREVVRVAARVGMGAAHEQRLHARPLRSGDVGLVRVADEEDLAWRAAAAAIAAT